MHSLNCGKIGTAALGLLALLAASGTAAQAQHAGGGGRGGMRGGNGGGQQGARSLVEMALPAGIAQPLYSPKVLGALDLTSDQKTAIAALLTTYETTAEPYQKEIGTDEAAAKALYEATPYDSSTATSTAGDEATAIGNLILAAQAVQADIYTNVLTTAQQADYVTAVTSSSSSSSSTTSRSDDSSSASSSHTPMLPTLAAMILRESTALSLTDSETTALQAIEAAQITSDTADLATVKSDLTAYTSAYNASTYDETALTSAVDTAEGDIATLLENDWAAQSAAFLTLTTAQQTTFLSATPSHGSGNSGGVNGDGVVYKITTAGAVTILHSFRDGSVSNDGMEPIASLTQDSTTGTLYGDTTEGGSTVNASILYGYGTLFSISTTGTYALLHSFGTSSSTDPGEFPAAALALNSTDGFLYGSTAFDPTDSAGTIFKTATGTTSSSTRFDFNGDGHADLLWYSSTSGALTAWDMDDTSVLT